MIEKIFVYFACGVNVALNFVVLFVIPLLMQYAPYKLATFVQKIYLWILRNIGE